MPVPSAEAVELECSQKCFNLLEHYTKKKLKVNGSMKFLLASVPQSYKTHIVSD